MPNIHTLRQKRAQLMLKTEQLMSADSTCVESAPYKALMLEVAKLGVEIENEDARLNAGARGGVRVGGGDDRTYLGADGVAPYISEGRAGKGPLPGGTKYADLFPGASLSTSGFHSSEEFFAAVARSNEIADPRLLSLSGIRAASGQRESAPSQGGFMVPTEWAAQLLDQSLEDEIVRPRAQIWPMKSNTIKVPAIDGYVHTGGVLYGGLVAAWENEMDNLQLQNIKLRLLELQANKLALLINSSNELLEDGSPDFATVLDVKLRIAAGWYLDQAFLFGSGAGQPRGVMNDPALLTVAIEAGQTLANGPLLYQNAVKMFGRLHPTCRKNAVWVANSDLIPALLEMQLVVKNVAGTENVGGSAVPVVSQDKDGQMLLLTRPIYFSEKCSAVGTPGDVILADFSQYAIGMRQDIVVQRSWHAGFTNDSSWFRLVTRLDGQGTWKSAITPENGQSLSWAVTLAQRS